MALTLMACPSHIMTDHLANTCGRMLQAMVSLVEYGREEIALVLFTVGERHHHLWGNIITANLRMHGKLENGGIVMTLFGMVNVVPPVTLAVTLQTCHGLTE